jgi:hypothetical protein
MRGIMRHYSLDRIYQKMLYPIMDKLTISLLMAALDNSTAAFLLFVTLSVIKVTIVIVCQRLWKSSFIIKLERTLYSI